MEKYTQETMFDGGFEEFIVSLMAYRMSKRANKNESLADVSDMIKLALLDDVMNIASKSGPYLVGDETGIYIATNNSRNVFGDMKRAIENGEEVEGLFHSKVYHVNGLYDIDPELVKVFEKAEKKVKEDEKKKYLLQGPELFGLRGPFSGLGF